MYRRHKYIYEKTFYKQGYSWTINDASDSTFSLGKAVIRT